MTEHLNPWSKMVLLAALCSPFAAAGAIPDQAANSPQSTPTVHKTVHPRKHVAKPSPAVPATPVTIAPLAPVAPPPPDWPVNSKPVDATVVWDSHGLKVDARNSSLQQILNDVSTDTGAKLEGSTPADLRVFGTYGPGPANEIISQLLNGTGFNVLIIGDQESGALRRIVLSAAPTGPAPQNSARNSGDEDDQPEQLPMNNGYVPQPRNAQQLEEMQLRQEQMQQQVREQLMQQQQQQQHQQQMPPDTAAPPPQLGK
jgi:hypothetical protein